MIDFGIVEEGQTGFDQNITASNSRNSSLTFDITSDSVWVTPSPAQVTIPALGSESITLTLDPSSLAIGDHTGTLTLTVVGTDCTGLITEDFQVTIKAEEHEPTDLIWGHSTAYNDRNLWVDRMIGVDYGPHDFVIRSQSVPLIWSPGSTPAILTATLDTSYAYNECYYILGGVRTDLPLGSFVTVTPTLNSIELTYDVSSVPAGAEYFYDNSYYILSHPDTNYTTRKTFSTVGEEIPWQIVEAGGDFPQTTNYTYMFINSIPTPLTAVVDSVSQGHAPLISEDITITFWQDRIFAGNWDIVGGVIYSIVIDDAYVSGFPYPGDVTVTQLGDATVRVEIDASLFPVGVHRGELRIHYASFANLITGLQKLDVTIQVT